MKDLIVTSRAFKNGEMIPKKYTCKGGDVNPPLEIKGIPAEAKSLALIMDDPDAPVGTWVHWVVWNIPLEGVEKVIAENSAPGIEGINSAGKHHYHGPCPPSGVHRYYFKFYALNAMLNLATSIAKRVIER